MMSPSPLNSPKRAEENNDLNELHNGGRLIFLLPYFDKEHYFTKRGKSGERWGSNPPSAELQPDALPFSYGRRSHPREGALLV